MIGSWLPAREIRGYVQHVLSDPLVTPFGAAGGRVADMGDAPDPTDGAVGPFEVAPQAARRGPVSVLFSDVCGYASLCESLDPEDLRDVMTEIVEGISGVAAKFDGRVDNVVGDAVLVLFGAPHPREDDALRAIMAACEIRDFVSALSPRLLPKTGRDLRTGVKLPSYFMEAGIGQPDGTEAGTRFLPHRETGPISPCSPRRSPLCRLKTSTAGAGGHPLKGEKRYSRKP